MTIYPFCLKREIERTTTILVLKLNNWAQLCTVFNSLFLINPRSNMYYVININDLLFFLMASTMTLMRSG